MNISAFYNKYPYPNTQIKSISELKNLKFQVNLLNIIKKYVKKGSVLEIGSGTGEMAMILCLNKYNVTATDISDKSLKISNSVAKKLNLKVNLLKMDILNPKKLRGFDITIANGVLHHTKNPKLGFENMVNLTKKNGKVILILYTKIGLILRKFLGYIIPIGILSLVFPQKPKSVIYDAFKNPREQSFSKNEILAWFNENKIKFIEYKNYGNVFLMIGKKN